MTREPSIHINKRDFTKIISDLMELDRKEVAQLVEEVFIRAKTKSITTRSLYASNEIMQKKLQKIVSASNDETHIFVKTLSMVRRKFHHRGIQDIKEGSKEWLTCKDVTCNALKFCEDFDLDVREGFTAYIEIALKITQKFFINKFLSLHEAITNIYEAEQVILSDKRPEGTRKLHSAFQSYLINKVGIPNDFSKKPDKYQYFVMAREIADEFGVSYMDYVEAQFKAFEWRNSIPEPIQMTGEKARERVIKWAFESNVNLKKKTEKRIDFAKIKNGL